jgi:hypothetical protein
MDELLFKNQQLITDSKNGDCFRACLTSLLSIQNSPNLPNGECWFLDWGIFLDKYGLSLKFNKEACWKQGFWIASVPSKNFKGLTHAIIMKNQEVYFDPSLKETYIIGENLLGKDLVKGGWSLEVINLQKVYKLKDFMVNLYYERTV